MLWPGGGGGGKGKKETQIWGVERERTIKNEKKRKMDKNELKLFYVIFFNTIDMWHDLIGLLNTYVKLSWHLTVRGWRFMDGKAKIQTDPNLKRADQNFQILETKSNLSNLKSVQYILV